MMNILEEIIAYKKIEIEKIKEFLPLDRLKKIIGRDAINRVSFSQKLKTKIDQKEIALIAEIKKASPSKGIIKEDFNHIEIAKSYKNGGATCLSVLTDKKYFQGDLKFIREIKEVVDLPILRKDFIIDPYQIYESIYNEADCVLLIVGAIHELPLRDLYDIACETEIDCLIEVHDEREIEIALGIDCRLIGINNRNLKTFQTNLNTTKKLTTKYKKDLEGKIIVSESGIFTNSDVESLMKSGVYVFLVGEGLMREKNIEEATRKLIQSGLTQ